MAPKSSPRVRAANKVDASKLAAALDDAKVEVHHAAALDDADRARVWEILEGNMRGLYTNSTTFSWDPPAKRAELFHRSSRFLLVRANDDGQIVAYTMFRFEHEEGEDLLYCYELQVAPSAQRTGLGAALVAHLHALAVPWHMEKIMLTVLKANEQAVAFYARLGFTMDPACPGYPTDDDDEEEEVDYEILSRVVAAP
ncbi:hypothetical protein PLICRDRAFT_35808 [Plicaturopsis crispa FD-325 SS-3]|nr:hypothetical protein PLICRDRAFT_35808 [Plicaturopsis crispa FD-325 SS-3]